MPKPLAVLQTAHLALLFGIPVSFAVLRIIAGAADLAVQRLGALVSVAGVAWAAAVAVGAIVYGSRKGVLKSLWSAYRGLLSRYWFLTVSNTLLIAIQCVVIWHLAMFRTVSIYSPENCILLLSDRPGEFLALGTVRGGAETRIRIRIGTRHLGCRHLQDGELVALAPVEIPGWWSADPLPSLKLPGSKKFEQLR